MKKICLFPVLLFILLFSACGRDLPLEEQIDLSATHGISMTTETDTVTSEGAVFLLRQNTELDIQYGDDYMLERLNKDTWEAVPTIITNYAFHCIAYPLPKDTLQRLEIDWTWLYGSLPAGEYRLVKEFMDFRQTGEYTLLPVSAAFTIS